jgi:uracil phosphoribosyltransferase
MKQQLIAVLRNRDTTMEQFREASERLAEVLAAESAAYLPKTTIRLHTPLAETTGEVIDGQVVLVSILRAGLTFLPSFLKFYPNALIGFVGARRNEVTAEPELYYKKLPPITSKNPILLLDPMLATGGSCCLAIRLLLEAGASESQITLISAVAAPEGVRHLKQEHPATHLIVAQVDERLNDKKFIHPGLGDFGDRYFGTVL